ncbi:hypothetical protein WKV44_08705 [Spirochaetia bacterium 38H-sp]|uniref:Uncharacterized protein n=1 Tax=Rarispira pelagica TaxID=3141764 RepID=A0ABU9UD83_9SPIR
MINNTRKFYAKKLLILVFLVLGGAFYFADISLDIGVASAANAAVIVSRPLGGDIIIRLSVFEDLAIVQFCGRVFSPLVANGYNDMIASLGGGVLFSPTRYLYIGMCSGIFSPMRMMKIGILMV